jgi:hypothetical protein
MVVEGWLPDYALKQSVDEFRARHYRYILTAGSPLLSGYYFSGQKTSADLAAATLCSLGLSSNVVIAAPGPSVARGRSRAHATAIKEWLDKHDPSVRSINVFSLGVHGRRTQMTFKSVFGKNMQIGIISAPDAAFDADRWWLTSEGFKTVSEEALGYCWYLVGGI